nr:amidohydrolase family protein [Dissulfurirhabdus thermomarina]
MVNAHCHLELSALRGRLAPAGSFAAWVRALVAAREQADPAEWEPAAEEAALDMAINGVLAVGDVGNTPLVPRLAAKDPEAWPLHGVFFREVIAPGGDSQDPGELHAETPDPPGGKFRVALSAHAPYSVAPDLLRAIKAWDRDHGLPFAVHVAESPEEVAFLRDGTGPIREFLEERGHIPPGFRPAGCSPVAALHRLGLLDPGTLCIHCVHLEPGDEALLAESGAAACLCPRSNVFLGVGPPPAERLHAAGVPLALGTDSLASNDNLSVFAEMASLARLAPGLPPGAVIEAATRGGARALALQRELGTLSRGRVAAFLAVGPAPGRPSDVLEFVIHASAQDKAVCYWIEDTP